MTTFDLGIREAYVDLFNTVKTAYILLDGIDAVVA